MAFRNEGGAAITAVDQEYPAPIASQIDRCRQARRSAADNRTVINFGCHVSPCVSDRSLPRGVF
jgi:hypothetical protein